MGRFEFVAVKGQRDWVISADHLARIGANLTYGDFGAIYLRLHGSGEVINLKRVGGRPVLQVWRTEHDSPAFLSTDQHIGYGLPIQMVVDTGADTNVVGQYAGDLDAYVPSGPDGPPITGSLEGIGGASASIVRVLHLNIELRGGLEILQPWRVASTPAASTEANPGL